MFRFSNFAKLFNQSKGLVDLFGIDEFPCDIGVQLHDLKFARSIGTQRIKTKPDEPQLLRIQI